MVAGLLVSALVIFALLGTLMIYNADCSKWIKAAGIAWIWFVIYSYTFGSK